jgi:hypothetical protein
VAPRLAIPRHPLALAGVLIATVAGAVFCALVIASIAGLFENPYAGLVIFIAIPALFVLGLLLIPAGVWLERRRLQRDPGASSDYPVLDFRKQQVRRTAIVVTALTAVNLVILLLAGYGSLHWMESPSFCGQVCHTPMHPQFAAWQAGPHNRIACVSCHIGEGPSGFVHAKLNGVRQMVEVATNSYPRPIPPGAHMPEGAQARTCSNCHSPSSRHVGDQVRVVREYADDEANSETKTILQMYLGPGSPSGHNIHWHADPSVRIEYVSTDAANETIPLVRVTNAAGQVKEYVTDGTKPEDIAAGTRKVMGCIDCHNTVGHPITPTPEQAVDRAIAAGFIDRQIPNARRESVRLVSADYPSQDEGAAAIERELRNIFKPSAGKVDQQSVERSVAAVRDLYRNNVFPSMKVKFGSYPTNRGHSTSTGCFRCHDGSHTAKDGAIISDDCEYCHKEITQ